MDAFRLAVIGVTGIYVLRGLEGLRETVSYSQEGVAVKPGTLADMPMIDQRNWWRANSRMKDGVIAAIGASLLLR
jgi:hypothetical protein